jgi:hypothetical protein
MSEMPTIPALHGTITVGVPIDRAFRVFTERFDTWWPREYKIGELRMEQAVLEPWVGG